MIFEQKIRMTKAITVFTVGVLLLTSALICNGCLKTSTGAPAKPFWEMNAKEKATFLMTMYNKQYDEYLKLYKKEDRTEVEQRILEDRYDLLQEMYPVIDTYQSYAAGGAIPTAETEQLAIELVNRALNL
jgi:hypothetical protein